MDEKKSKKVLFFELFNLRPITPENRSSKILENRSLVSPRNYKDLLQKNNRIKTGYENFCIKKGSIKLLPYKDFDFVDKHVVCQKCFQKFPSKLSYKEHVGTGICVRTYHGHNPIYLKYKNRNNIQNSLINKKNIEKDFHCHDINIFFSNPEMLNTLQTRNKCYSDINDEDDEVDEKPMNNSNKNNESTVKKLRDRPKHIIASNSIETKNQSRPYSLKDMTVYGSSKNDNSSSSLEINDSIERRILSYNHADDAYKNIINTRTRLKPIVASEMKDLSKSYWKTFKVEQKQNEVNINKYEYASKHQTQCHEEKSFCLQIKEIENALSFISKKIRDKNEFNELESMVKKLSKVRKEYKPSKLKKTDINKESIRDEGIENIQCTPKKNKNETENEFKKKKYLGIDYKKQKN